MCCTQVVEKIVEVTVDRVVLKEVPVYVDRSVLRCGAPRCCVPRPSSWGAGCDGCLRAARRDKCALQIREELLDALV